MDKSTLLTLNYLYNKLPDTEIETVETRRRVDHEFNMILNGNKRLKKKHGFTSIDEHLAWFEKQKRTSDNFIEVLEKRYEAQKGTKKKGAKTFKIGRFGRKARWTVAASLILLLYAVPQSSWYNSTSADKKVMIIRPQSGIDEEAYLAAVDDGRYAEAVPLLEDEISKGTNVHGDVHFLYAVCQFKLKEFAIAIEHFQKSLRADQATQYEEDAQWFLAVSYLEIGNKEKAVQELKTYISEGYSNIKRKEQATKMVKRLEGWWPW